MPCHPARARELVRKGKAVRRFNRGIFYIQLTEREGGETQMVAVGIDPGSKKEGFTVKSEKHTFLNINADAVSWVAKNMQIRRDMRRGRRSRNSPYRSARRNRKCGRLPPSTSARWDWKFRVARWLNTLYPVSVFVVEDVKARTTRRRRWNAAFSPLEWGKSAFYESIRTLARVSIISGWKTKEIRDSLGLRKTKNKLDDVFDAHCVDSWVLASTEVGGTVPDNTRLLLVSPLRFHRRQLHVTQPAKGGVRKSYGGTRSLGFKRGSLVKHVRHGFAYVGGTMNGRITLHSIADGSRISRTVKPKDCLFFAYSSWRAHLMPLVAKGAVA